MPGEPELWSGAFDPPRHLRWRRGPKRDAPGGDAEDVTVPEPDTASGETEIRAARIAPRTKAATPAPSAAGASDGGTAAATPADGATTGTTASSPAGPTPRDRDENAAQRPPLTGSAVAGAGRRVAKARRRGERFLRRN